MTESSNPIPTFPVSQDLSALQMATADKSELSRFTVLIVDDEPMLRSVIQDFLLMLGFENQRVAGDGIEALATLRAEPIDFMLSDIRMPKMELEELLGIVRKEFPRLVVVATSGFSDLESSRNIFVKGAHDFIGKPLNLDALELVLQWIVERQRVLQVAEGLFGQGALPVPLAEADTRITTLAQALRAGTHHFSNKMQHALRMAELVTELHTGLETPHRLDLQVAALLHELGMGYQIQTLCRQPRSLDDGERRLVQEHAQISARLVSWTLDRPEFMTIIGHHLTWSAALIRPESSWTGLDRLAVWLGILNCLDGYVHDRPDRPATPPTQLKAIFAHKYKNTAQTPMRLLLEQWERVEAFFARAAEAS